MALNYENNVENFFFIPLMSQCGSWITSTPKKVHWILGLSWISAQENGLIRPHVGQLESFWKICPAWMSRIPLLSQSVPAQALPLVLRRSSIWFQEMLVVLRNIFISVYHVSVFFISVVLAVLSTRCDSVREMCTSKFHHFHVFHELALQDYDEIFFRDSASSRVHDVHPTDLHPYPSCFIKIYQYSSLFLF